MSGSIGGPAPNTISQFPIPGPGGSTPTQGFQMPQMGGPQPAPMQAQLPPWAQGGTSPANNLTMFGNVAQVPPQFSLQGMGVPQFPQGGPGQPGQPGQPGGQGNNPYLAGLAPLLQAIQAQMQQGGGGLGAPQQAGGGLFGNIPPVQPQPFLPPTLPAQAAPQTAVPGLGMPGPPPAPPTANSNQQLLADAIAADFGQNNFAGSQ